MISNTSFKQVCVQILENTGHLDCVEHACTSIRPTGLERDIHILNTHTHTHTHMHAYTYNNSQLRGKETTEVFGSHVYIIQIMEYTTRVRLIY